MENLKHINFYNHTNDDVRVLIKSMELSLIIKANSSKKTIIKTDDLIIVIEKLKVKKSIISTIFSMIIAAVISIPLWLINGFEFESIKDSITLKTKFKAINISDVKKADFNIYTDDSYENFNAYQIEYFKEKFKGEVEYLNSDLKEQIKEYTVSIIVMLIFPFVICLGLIIISFYKNILVLGIVSIIVLVLFLFQLIRIHITNKKIIASISVQFHGRY